MLVTATSRSLSRYSRALWPHGKPRREDGSQVDQPQGQTETFQMHHTVFERVVFTLGGQGR